MISDSGFVQMGSRLTKTVVFGPVSYPSVRKKRALRATWKPFFSRLTDFGRIWPFRAR
jgi:hypothetical protein